MRPAYTCSHLAAHPNRDRLDVHFAFRRVARPANASANTGLAVINNLSAPIARAASPQEDYAIALLDEIESPLPEIHDGQLIEKT